MLVSDFTIITTGGVFLLFFYLSFLDIMLGFILARTKYTRVHKLLFWWEHASFFYFGLSGIVCALILISFLVLLFIIWNQMSLSGFINYIATMLIPSNYCFVHQNVLHVTTCYISSTYFYFDFFLLHQIFRWGKMLWVIIMSLHALFFYVLACSTIYTFVTSAWTWFYLRLFCLFVFDELDYWVVAKRLAKRWEAWADTL